MTQVNDDEMAGITAYLAAIEHAANNDGDNAFDVLNGHITDDDEIAERKTWGLTGAAPMIAAHGVRRIFGDNVPPGGVWAIGSVPGVQIDRVVDPHALAAIRTVVEHLNYPDGAGIEPAMDIVTAHYRQHGPEGVIRIVLELVKFGAFLWREGGFTPKATP